MSGGLRYNAGKVRVELLPVEWPWALAEVSTKGSEKYLPRNWEKGMAWSIMVGCALRHLYKFIRGERYDPETGCHHLAMAAWNVLALMSYDIRQVGENDLPEQSIGYAYPTLEVKDAVRSSAPDRGQEEEPARRKNKRRVRS